MLLKSILLIIVILLPSFVSAVTNEDDSMVQSQCKKISDKLASLSYKRCLSHKLQIADGRSVKGLPILVKNFYTAPNKNVSDKNEMEETTHQRILLVGGIHGNEYASVSVIFKWITLIDRYYTGSYDWQIVPLLNPDGLLQRSSSRTNANGVDLDRNFPTSDSDYNAIQYWKENTNRDSKYFPGDHELSEPESQWLAKKIVQYRPDAIIVIHAPHNSLIYDSSGTKQSKNAAQYQQSIATNPGSFNQFVGTEMNIPILTVELAYSEIMPANTEIIEIWKNLLKWLNLYIESS